MALFGGSSSKSSTINDNTGQDSSNDNNSGALAYGGDVTFNQTLSDHGAIAGGVGLGQAALLANNAAVRAVLDASGAMSADAFNFGSKSLDLGAYAIDSNLAISGKAISAVSGSANDVIGKIAGFASDILANGQRATTEALGFAKNMSQSESANQSELMIKAMTVLGIVAVLGFALTRGKK